jgi:hypothetical protein
LGALIPGEVYPYQMLPLLPLAVLLAARAVERRRWPVVALLAICLLAFVRQPCDLWFPNLWTLGGLGLFVLAASQSALFRADPPPATSPGTPPN